MSVLVTGAMGAVGSRVVDLLCDMGIYVVAIDIHGVNKKYKRNPDVIPYELDLGKVDEELESTLNEILLKDRIVCVINTAAIVDIAQPWEKIRGVNYDFVTLLSRLKFPYDHNIVHISTGSIYKNDGSLITEKTPLKTKSECESPYEESKRMAEKVLLNKRYYARFYDKDRDKRTIILRPALIYGPSAKFLGAALAAVPFINKSISHRAIGFSGGPETNWVHCDDVARACVWAYNRLLNADGDIYEEYNVADDTAYGFGDTVTHYMKSYGLNVVREIPLPSPVTLSKFRRFLDNNIVPSLINAPLKRYWKLLKFLWSLEGNLNVSVDKEFMPYLFKDTVFSNYKIKEAGFKFKYPDSRKAIPSVLRWYNDNEWIG